MKNYETLLANAPDHNSPEFLDYLREHNRVVGENSAWLVIENYKYHLDNAPWYTAFHKEKYTPSFSDIQELGLLFQQFDLIIKSPLRRTVTRFHVHITKI